MKYCLDKRQMLLGCIMITAAGLSTVCLVITVSSDQMVTCIEYYNGEIREIPLVLPNITTSTKPYLCTNLGFWRSCNQFTDENRTSITMILNVQCEKRRWAPPSDDAKTTEAPKLEEGEDRTKLENITSAILDHPLMKFVFVFTALGLCIEITGHLTCLVDQKFTKKKSFLFITGVLYVFAGLSLLAGIVIFMGIITEESMHQKEVAKDMVAKFRYTYGSSFALLALSFCLIETAGILAVYLFIIRYKVAYKRRHTKLHVLKSHSELLNEFLSKRRMNSASSDSSRRPSFQPSIQHNGVRLSNTDSPPINGIKTHTTKRELSPARTVLTAVTNRSFCGNYEQMLENDIETNCNSAVNEETSDCGPIPPSPVIDCTPIPPPPSFESYILTSKNTASIIPKHNDTTV